MGPCVFWLGLAKTYVFKIAASYKKYKRSSVFFSWKGCPEQSHLYPNNLNV